jgi:hypothetical protein
MGASRRRILALLAAAAGASSGEAFASSGEWSLLGWLRGLIASPRRPARTLHVTPSGAGARTGRAWGDAATIDQLNALIQAAGPGGEVLLAADQGVYHIREPIIVSSGGARARPVTVRAIDSANGAPADAEFRGGRAEPFNPAGERGSECFRLTRGADHLRFRRIQFRNVGNGCFRIGAPVADLTIEDCAFRNVYRFIETTASGSERQASIRGFAVRRCRGAGVERSFARIRYDSARGVLEDCRADSQANEGEHIPAGCALDDSAHDIVFRRCVMENFRQNSGDGYWNGDGFSDEPRNYGISYEQCEARGCTDGGFDCKSAGVVLDRCIAEDNKRNFRLWGAQATLRSCISRNPNWRGAGRENGGPAHIWLGGRRARVDISRLRVDGDGSVNVFEFEGSDTKIRVDGYRFNVGPAARIIESNGNPGNDVRFIRAVAN